MAAGGWARVVIFLLTVWLAACVPPPETAAPASEPSASPTAAALVTVAPTATSSRRTLTAVADARFVVQTIAIESTALAAADFNNDGHMDLVAAGEPELTIFLGDGAGGLAPFSRAPGGTQPDDFALTDVDEDGDVDIIVANHDTRHLTLLLGEGNGRFQPAPGSPLAIDVSPHPHAVRAADLDGDGRIDLIVDHRDGEGLLLLPGLGGGQFDLPGVLQGVGGDPYRGLAVGDINGDGRLDLVTPNPDDAGVLLNVSSGQIAFVQAPPVAAVAPFAVALGEFNGDGRLDLMTAADEGSPLVQLFLGDGRGGFSEAPDSPYDLARGGKQIVVGDFNGDGVDDAVVCSYFATDVMMLLGGPEAMKVSTLPGGEHPWGLAVADFNGDGRDDLVVADDGAPVATLYLSLAPE